MNEYDPKYWKHGVNVTVGQFCDHIKKNIPSDAVLIYAGIIMSACTFRRRVIYYL